MGILLRIIASLLGLFVMAKCCFICTYAPTITLQEFWAVLLHGLAHDMGIVGYVSVVPTLLLWIAVEWRSAPLRRLLMPYLIAVWALASVVLVVDHGLYAFWHFKLDATVFAYIDSPSGAMASVSLGYIALRVFIMLLLVSLGVSLFTRKSFYHYRYGHGRVWHFGYVVVLALLFLCIRGGISESTLNVGRVYHSSNSVLNHAAVNPLFSLLYTATKQENYGKKFRYMPANQAHALVNEYLPKATEANADSVLFPMRPNVLLLIWEGGGGAFFPSLGGVAEATPCLQASMRQGMRFSHLYGTTFRTDRALASLLSGEVSYPDLSVMRLPRIGDRLPSLAHTLAGAGYRTSFVYGGDIFFTNMHGYLVAGGYEHIVADHDFTAEERATGKWGVQDSIVLDALYDKLVADTKLGTPWFTTCLTLSSHEPFEVPFHASDDKILNSIAYTDYHVGRLLERMSRNPQLWDNTLVIVTPDHNIVTTAYYLTERFHRIPMLWTGGVIRHPSTCDKLMSQSDIAATLLAALGLPHADFHYSRNVLSPSYTSPSAYASTPEGLVWIDSTGYSIYNLTNEQTMEESPEDEGLRVLKAKAMLQTSYDRLQKLNEQ